MSTNPKRPSLVERLAAIQRQRIRRNLNYPKNLYDFQEALERDMEKVGEDLRAHLPTDLSLPKESGSQKSGLQSWAARVEEAEAMKKASGIKLPKVVHWRSGRWGVVAGPFPEGFFRTETRDTWQKASKLYADTAAGRAGTTRDDQFAKVRLEDILEIETENEWGPVCP